MVNAISLFNGVDATVLANALLAADSGLTVVGATYIGANAAAGTFDSLDFGQALGSSIGHEGSGVVLSTGSAQIPFSNTQSGFTTDHDGAGDTDLTGLVQDVTSVDTGPGIGTRDAAVLEIQFIFDNPSDSFIAYDAIFGSEEFPDQDQGFTDISGTFVDELDNSLLFNPEDPNSVLAVTTENVNNAFFLDNDPFGVAPPQAPSVDLDVEFDGVTRVLSQETQVGTGNDTQDGVVHTIKFAIADTTDGENDTALFLSNLRASDGSGSGGGGGEPETVLTISPNVTVTEGTGAVTPMEFTISRSGNLNQTTTVDYLRTPFAPPPFGDEVEAEDLTGPFGPSGTLTFNPGETTKVIFYDAVGDVEIEPAESFILAIDNASNDGGAPVFINNDQSIGTIIDNDLPPPPSIAGAAWGDPHLITFDGLMYDFQSAGEFVLVQSTDEANPLEMQIRTTPVSDVVSVVTAFATEVGDTRVTINALEEVPLRIDGVETAFDTSGPVTVGDGDLFFDGQTITITYGSGDQVRVDLFEDFLSVQPFLDEVLRPSAVQGLLGNADGVTTNDLAAPDGTPFDQPLSFTDLYGTYANGWRVTQESSLFDYGLGQDTNTFTNPGLPVADITIGDFVFVDPVTEEEFDEPVISDARALVAGASITNQLIEDALILDVALTGDTDFIAAAERLVAEPIEVLEPIETPLDNDLVGIRGVGTSQPEGDTGDQVFQFEVYRTGDASALSNAIQVDYAIQTVGRNEDGLTDDEINSDLFGRLTFTASTRSQVIQINVAGDDIPEDDEELTVSISLIPLAADPLLVANEATIIVENDDGQPPSVFALTQVGSGPATEGNGGETSVYEYTVTRTGSTLEQDTVEFVVAGGDTDPADGDDFIGGALPLVELVFNPGEETKTVLVEVAGDDDFEADETFTVSLANANGAEIDPANAVIDALIVNDDEQDPPEFNITADLADQPEGSDGTTEFRFTVERENDPAGLFTVDFSVTGSGANPADADDFGGTLPSGTLVFADQELSKTIILQVVGDADGEQNEGFTVSLSNPSGLATVGTAAVDGVIRDDDGVVDNQPGELAIEATDAENLEGDTDSVIYTFTVNRTGGSDGPVSADFVVEGSGANPLDEDDIVGGVLPSGTVTFADGEVIQTITVEIAGDEIDENNETFTVTLSNPGGGATLGTSVANGTVEDDDAVPVAEDDFFTFVEGTILEGNVLEANGGDADQDNDGLGLIVSRVSGPSNGTLDLNDDGTFTYDPDSAFIGTDTFVYQVEDEDGDTDTATVSVTVEAITVQYNITSVFNPVVDFEGTGVNTPRTFRITRTGDTSVAGSVSYAIAGTGLNPVEAADFAGGVLPTGTVSFAAGQTTADVTIQVNGDSLEEADESYEILLSDPVVEGSNGSVGNSVISTIFDDDPIEIGGTSGNDRIELGPEDDIVDGGQGNDRINAGSGDDLVLGGNGNDRINGGNGNDLLSGGGRNDRINGESGADLIDGGDGKDRIDGGNGNDFIEGGAGRDRLEGGNDNDTLSGGADRDRLNGGPGNDVLDGGSGRDRLDGEEGNDTLNGGTDRDKLTGGVGADTFVYESGGDRDKIRDFDISLDVLDLSGVNGVETLDDLTAALIRERGDARFDFGGDDELRVKGLDVDQIPFANIIL